jgi:hypothetical protein
MHDIISSLPLAFLHSRRPTFRPPKSLLTDLPLVISSSCLDAVVELRPFGPVLARVLGWEIPLVPLRLGDLVLGQDLGERGVAGLVDVLKLGAVGDNARHRGNRNLVWSRKVAALDGTGVLVSGHADAHGNVSLETKALLADLAGRTLAIM